LRVSGEDLRCDDPVSKAVFRKEHVYIT
jgi:hypothetical protein